MATSSTSWSSTSAATIGLHSTSPIQQYRSALFCWPSRSRKMKLQAGPDDRGLRLDVFLARNLADLTRSQIQLLNRSGAVQIQGRHDKAGYKIRGGETIEIDLRALAAEPLTPEQMPLQ